MTLAPLLNAPLAIQLHTFGAASAFVIGIIQFAAPKGTVPHRTLGWVWSALMLGVALSSFLITGVAGPGRFSWIHLLSVLTLAMLPVALWAARSGRIAVHERTMKGIFIGGLVIAGAFTFLPARILGQVVFGG